MLTEIDLDYLKYYTKSNPNKAYVYYVAHMIEPREGVIDESNYKDISKFKIIKLKVKDINNAYFEYLNYLNNRSNYHIEEEECYYDSTTKYINEYIVPNAKSSYDIEFTSRVPSVIFGIIRKVFDIDTNELSWKYKALLDPEICDGLEYQYVTSDWYILDIENFPTVEKPLVNVKQKNAYFMNLEDAYNYLKQLIA